MRPARLACGAAALALAAGGAWAERVVVRSGEHDGFTRIVLGFEAPPRFSTERLEGAWRLDPEGPASYDLTDAWRRIERSRITAIEPRPDGALVLRLGCDCDVAAFSVGQAMIAIDVADREPAPEPPAEPAPVPAAEPAPLPPVFLPDLAAGSGLPLVTPIPAARPTPAPEPAPPPGPDLAALGADLAAQLQNGVDRGLLDPAPPLARAGVPSRPTGELRVAAPSGLAEQISVGPPRSAVCPEGEVARLLPGRGEGTAEALSTARAGLFGELDRVDPEGALDLTRELLSAGFGAEARSVLRLGPLGEADRATLDALATLVDAGPPEPGARLLEPWASCEGDAALWAVLALEGRPLPRVLDRGGVVGALSALAPPLRTHLAPRLAAIFLDDGDSATARLVRNAATREGGGDSRAMRLLGARLTLLDEPSDFAALEELAQLVSGRDDVAIEAAHRLFDAAGGVVPSRALQDAGILVAERRGRPDGEALRGVLGRALVEAGEWDEAISLAGDGPADAPGTAALWEATVAGLVDAAPDPAFLRLAFAEADTFAAAPVSPETRASIAERLDALGFGARAPAPEAPVAAAPPEPAPTPLPPVPEPAPTVGLAGPITSGQRSLDESRRRRADLAARIEALGLEALEPAASTLR